ncbi:MAG: hypothetical protein LBK74_03955 [Treponema sp.]|jgi:hypothetical protein|nr:hypothetical protein [Treponema sp.]
MEEKAVTLRRRSGWEAADMGILLWRLNWKPLLLFIGIPITLCTAAARFIPPDKLFIANIVLWWALPLMDRFTLQVVSVRFFEPGSPVKRLFKGLGKTIRQGLAGDLLWRRFSPWRSARMPIVALEKQKGRQLRRRREFLSRNSLDFGFPLTLICLGLKTILSLGEAAFAYVICRLFFPWVFPNVWTFLENGMGIMLITSWFNDILIESLYVCMGFGLYINSRVETEGWDIELLFKENAQKAPVIQKTAAGQKTPAVKTAMAPSAVAAVLAALLACTVPAGAEETAEPPAPAAEAVSAELYTAEPADARDAALLEEVYTSPDFGTSRQSWRIRFKKNEGAAAVPRFRDLPQLQEVSGLLLRAFVAAALVTGLVFGLRFALKKRRASVSGTGGGTLSGTVETAADPEGLLEKAAALHGEGKIREGWALCFLAFIAALTKRGISFPGEATEYEALALVRRSGVDAGPFENFIRRWIPFAYGGRTPEEGSFAASLEACRGLAAEGGTG